MTPLRDKNTVQINARTIRKIYKCITTCKQKNNN